MPLLQSANVSPLDGRKEKPRPSPLQESPTGYSAYAYDDPFASPSPGPFEVVFDVDEYALGSPRTDKRRKPKSTEAQCSYDSPSPTSATFLRKSKDSYYSPLFSAQSDGRFPRHSFAGSIGRKHPFGDRFSNFEAPQWRKLGLHFALCSLAYPFLLIFVIVGQGKTLFWTRLFTGAGCGLLGVMMSVSLLGLARGVMEAATWATVIHQSRVSDSDGPGVRLKDLAAHSDDPASAMNALRLVWDRHQYPGADREYRRFYDSRPWSIWILFFLANIGIAGMLPFILGRFVDIEVDVVRQYEQYSETAVKGDLSADDLSRADDLLPAFNSFALTWTLAPFSVHGGLPPVVSFPWQNDSVYFSEIVLSQLTPNGSGFGTFESNSSLDITGAATPQLGKIPGANATQLDLERGSLLRFPRWGIRINCLKIPDAANNIIPLSENNMTYMFTPRDTLQTLFSAFDISFPQILEEPLNLTATIHPNDTLPGGLNISMTAMGGMFWDNGVAHSTKSSPLSMGQDGSGFVTIESILIRLNTTYAPHGNFPVLSKTPVVDEGGGLTHIGYDAAVCLQLYEPWVLDVYNSSVGLPTSTRIVDKGPVMRDMDTPFLTERRNGGPLNDNDWDGPVSRSLNSSAMKNVYITSHQNSVNNILKDNGRDSFYVPSPTLISFTSGQGPYGYTELSADYYAKSRALADAGNVLPYFAGSGWSLARQYRDKEVASATINNRNFALVIVVVFIMGCISAFFLPRLPLGNPRRGFDLYSWMTAFAAQELVPDRASGLEKQMELSEIVEHAGPLKFRYVG